MDERLSDLLHQRDGWHAWIFSAPTHIESQNGEMFETRNNLGHPSPWASCLFGFFGTTGVPVRVRQ